MRKTVVAILKKLLHTVILLLVLSFVVFSFIRLIPGDPVKISMGPMTPEETIAQNRALPIQWAHWLKGVITEGDFGESLFTHRNVAEDIKQYLPKSLELVFYCAILILIVGVAVGTISAIFKNSWLDNLIRFIRLLSDENGLNISQRNITVSTCGIVPKILKLAEEGLSITLALSLHAPDDETRKTLMPIANSYSLSEVLPACKEYYKKTGRRLTFEYSLVQGVNDNLDEAKRLTALLKDMQGHVNLIPVNPIKERDFKQSNRDAIDAFRGYLEKHGINVTIRREMGRDIGGACGQLRKSYLSEEESS